MLYSLRLVLFISRVDGYYDRLYAYIVRLLHTGACAVPAICQSSFHTNSQNVIPYFKY